MFLIIDVDGCAQIVFLYVPILLLILDNTRLYFISSHERLRFKIRKNKHRVNDVKLDSTDYREFIKNIFVCGVMWVLELIPVGVNKLDIIYKEKIVRVLTVINSFYGVILFLLFVVYNLICMTTPEKLPNLHHQNIVAQKSDKSGNVNNLEQNSLL